MELNEVVSRAKEWAASSGSGIEVSSINEGERRIYLTSPVTSFFITVPQHHGQEEWGVWSSNEDCINILSSSMEKLSKASNTVEEVLELATDLLTAATRTGGGEEGVAEQDMDSEEVEEEEEESDFGGYYSNDFDEDPDVADKDEQKSDDETSAMSFFTGEGSPAAVHRLLADLKALTKSVSKFGIAGHPVKDNLFEWEVELGDFPSESLLAKDLERYASRGDKGTRKPVITMEMKFPKDYPMNPPFVRVLRPRFKFLTGHVTIGGSICMQMLTRSGWSPSNDIESILVQIRAEIMSDPNARLDLSGSERDYSEQEAKAAFERMMIKYGWKS